MNTINKLFTIVSILIVSVLTIPVTTIAGMEGKPLAPTGGAITLLGETAGEEWQPGGEKIVGKEPLPPSVNPDNSFPIYHVKPIDTECVDECMRRNQMHSVGFEVIQEQCVQECDFDRIIGLLQSQNSEDYQRGVTELTKLNTPRAVQPLIIALKRDLKERTGLWAWIIPALGALGDSAAVPLLIETLTLPHDDWLGREMSARALGDIGDPAAVPFLLAAAWRGDTRDQAIIALAGFKDMRSIPVLLSALDTNEDPETEKAAIRGLDSLGVEAVPALIQAFEDYTAEYQQTRRRVLLCHLLGKSGDNQARQTLREHRQDPDSAVRSCVSGY